MSVSHLSVFLCLYSSFFLFLFYYFLFFFFFQAEDGIRDHCVTGVQTCALPILLGNFTARARVVAQNLAALLTSFDQTKGIRYLTSTILNLAMSVNGFDDFGHYLRTTLLAGCNSLATTLNQACSANFVNGSSSAASAASASRPRSAVDRLLAGEDPNKVMAEYRRKHPGKKLPKLAAVPSSSGQ